MNSFDELKVHVSSDPRAEAERKRLEDEKIEKTRKIKKLLPIVIPCVIVALLLIATIPSYFSKLSDYKAATAMMTAGKYDEAKEAFEALGSYADSEDQAKYNVEYYRALSVVSEGDALIDNQGEMAVDKYEEALSMLKALDGYGDSKTRIEEINEKIRIYDESVRAEEYRQAEELLEKGKYVSAADAFKKLGKYKDSADMINECMYRRAMVLVDYIRKNEVRGVYANPTYDNEGYEVEVTKYPVLQMRPICEVAAEELRALGDYKDCTDVAAECEEKGNFKKEFLELCANGQMVDAVNWLNTYDDVFDERQPYQALINATLPYNSSWELYRGDSTVLPISGGLEKKSVDIDTKVSIEDGVCYLTISGIDAEFTVKLTLADNGSGFIFSPDENTHYYAIINNQKHFTYTRYNGAGKIVSSCEYNVP